jgi:tetratricopeptide (TPR) repeat protein
MTPPAEPVHWSRLLAGAARLPAESRNLLLGIAAEATNPPIIRTTAMGRLNLRGDSLGVSVVGQQLASNNALIRLGAARALQTAVPEARARLVPPLLDDPVKAVRMAAVMSLAPLGADVLPAGKQQSFNKAVDEYIAAQLLNAERGEAHTNIANLQRHLGRNDLAEQAYRTALKVNDRFVPAYVNLADLYRALGDEQAADATLRKGLEIQPEQAALRHSLGLSLVRQGNMAEAAPELEAAAASPDATPRYALAYGLVLDSQGEPEAARTYLAVAIDRFGDDPALVSALVNFYQRDGELEKARELAARLPRQ